VKSRVVFAELKLKEAYEKLEESRTEDKNLRKDIWKEVDVDHYVRKERESWNG